MSHGRNRVDARLCVFTAASRPGLAAAGHEYADLPGDRRRIWSGLSTAQFHQSDMLSVSDQSGADSVYLSGISADAAVSGGQLAVSFGEHLHQPDRFRGSAGGEPTGQRMAGSSPAKDLRQAMPDLFLCWRAWCIWGKSC